MEEALFWSVVTARHCKRAFLDRPVPRGLLEAVLRAAANAPSTRNTQLWRVEVVTGPALESLAGALCAAFDRGEPQCHDYVNRPAELPPAARDHAAAYGAGILRAKGIARDDEAARRAHLRDNFRFYGAPAAMVFHLGAGAAPGTFLEMGLFLQNVLLGLVAAGLGGCPQYSVTGYSDRIRAQLGLGPDRLLVCGLATGYVDEAAPVNRFAPGRAFLDGYVRWHDQAPSSGDQA